MEHIHNLFLPTAECRAPGLLVEMLLKSRNTDCLFLFLYTLFFSSPFGVLADSALLQPFYLDNGYSYYVSTCFASPYQFILVCVYEKYFATQWYFVKWYKPFQCNLISSCMSFPISCWIRQLHSMVVLYPFSAFIQMLHKARQVLTDDNLHEICCYKCSLHMVLKGNWPGRMSLYLISSLCDNLEG